MSQSFDPLPLDLSTDSQSYAYSKGPCVRRQAEVSHLRQERQALEERLAGG